MLSYLNLEPAQVQWFFHDSGNFSISVTAHVHPLDADVIMHQAITQCDFKLIEIDDQLFKDEDPVTVVYTLKDEVSNTTLTLFTCSRTERRLTYILKEKRLSNVDQFVHGQWRVEPKWKMHLTPEEE